MEIHCKLNNGIPTINDQAYQILTDSLLYESNLTFGGFWILSNFHLQLVKVLIPYACILYLGH